MYPVNAIAELIQIRRRQQRQIAIYDIFKFNLIISKDTDIEPNSIFDYFVRLSTDMCAPPCLPKHRSVPKLQDQHFTEF